MYFKRIVPALFMVALVLTSTLAVTYEGQEALSTAATPISRPMVIIDAGHGGLPNTID